MKILEELWYGNVAPGERSVDKGDRLWNLGRLILQNEEELAPLLWSRQDLCAKLFAGSG